MASSCRREGRKEKGQEKKRISSVLTAGGGRWDDVSPLKGGRNCQYYLLRSQLFGKKEKGDLSNKVGCEEEEQYRCHKRGKKKVPCSILYA